MGLSSDQLQHALTALAQIEPAFQQAVERAGFPAPRLRERGYSTLLRTIVGQQVSVHAANAVWNRLDTAIGGAENPRNLSNASDETLRAAGLSRQKSGYARSLSDLILSDKLRLDDLPSDDEEAIALLTQVKGIGRWSAEIYLLFAEGRPDVWPAGDLAVQIEVGRILGHAERPSEKLVRELAEAWRPHRGAAAIMAWHSYSIPRDKPLVEGAPDKLPL